MDVKVAPQAPNIGHRDNDANPDRAHRFMLPRALTQ